MLFGLFHGHSGVDVAKFAKMQFKNILIKTDEYRYEKYEAALKKTFLKLDEDCHFWSKNVNTFKKYSGATACVLLITKNEIYCANVGDTKALLA